MQVTFTEQQQLKMNIFKKEKQEYNVSTDKSFKGIYTVLNCPCKYLIHGSIEHFSVVRLSEKKIKQL